MKNNKGFGRFEVITLIVILLVVFAGGAVMILRGANKQRLQTFKDNAVSFSSIVATNENSFRNLNVVYLDEVINEKYGKKIKNPLGAGYCDPTQSRVNIKDGKAYTTLRCGEYLIDNSTFRANDKVPIYKVSDWSENKPEGENVEEKVLYNCVDNGKEVFDQYYEDFYLVYKVYLQYNEEYRFVNNIKNVCKVVEKTFYRTKEEIEQNRS